MFSFDEGDLVLIFRRSFWVMLAFLVTSQVDLSWASFQAKRCSDLLTEISLPVLQFGKVDQYFSTQFLNDLNSQNIQLSLDVRAIQNKKENFLLIELMKNNYVRIGKVKLTPSLKDPSTIHLGELSLMDPRPQLKSNSKHQTQIHKGLPFSFFQAFKRQLFSDLKKAGYKKVVVAGAQDYTVFLLYLKTMNAQLTSSQAQLQIQYLDKVFNQLKAHKNLPIQMISRNDLSLLIKNVEEPPNQFEFEEAGYNKLSQSERLQKFEHIYNETGQLIAIYKKSSDSSEFKKFFLIDPFYQRSVRFIHWSRWHSQKNLSFEVIL